MALQNCAIEDMNIKLMDEVNDARLLSVAAARMNNFDPSTLVSQEAIYAEFGITK